MSTMPHVIWPEFVQFGNAVTPGPKIPLDRERAEKALRKNPKAYAGIAQAQSVFLTAYIRDMTKRPYAIIRMRYITPEECHGLLWCCIEKGFPPHVSWYMDHLGDYEPETREPDWEPLPEWTGNSGE